MAEPNSESVPSADNGAIIPVEQEPSERNNDNKDDQKMLSELMYCFESFHAIVTPVTLTMILSALAVVHINTDETREIGAETFSNSYTVIDLEDDNSSQNFFASLGNTFIMVFVIGILTFGVVALYKYRCMKFLLGYLIVSMSALLGFVTGAMWKVAIDKYRMRVDKVSYYLFLFNYSIVGTMAIFSGKGIPRWVTQAYLVAASVALAWQLSYFDEWTAWTGLIMLALYDLFAVLTPCGPLKALVKQMQQSNAPELPSLLYEARLPRGGVARLNNEGGGGQQQAQPRQQQQQQQQSQPSHIDSGTSAVNMTNEEPPIQQNEINSILTVLPSVSVQIHSTCTAEPHVSNVSVLPVESQEDSGEREMDEQNAGAEGLNESSIEIEMTVLPSLLPMGESVDDSTAVENSLLGPERSTPPSEGEATGPSDSPIIVDRTVTGDTVPSAAAAPTTTTTTSAVIDEVDNIENRPRGRVPLAIAKIYKLTVIDEDGILRPQPPRRRRRRRRDNTNNNNGDNDDGLPRIYSPEQVRSTDWTPKQLRSEVTVTFPRGGGSIRRSEERSAGSSHDNGAEYVVYNRRSEVVTTYTVTKNGEVLRVVRRDNPDDDDIATKDNIKLGLGDFIFYSVLVSKAALYSFTAFATCMLVILAGLGGTLVLLSLYKTALPALPISIFLAVTFYLMTRLFVEPWIQCVLHQPMYV